MEIVKGNEDRQWQWNGFTIVRFILRLAGGKLLVVVETGGHLSFFVLEFLGIDFSGAQY